MGKMVTIKNPYSSEKFSKEQNGLFKKKLFLNPNPRKSFLNHSHFAYNSSPASDETYEITLKKLSQRIRTIVYSNDPICSFYLTLIHR
jgi:hypothetical protein